MTDKIDWRTLQPGEHVTVTFDAEVERPYGYGSGLLFKIALSEESPPYASTAFGKGELDKATITKKEQPLEVGDRVDLTDLDGKMNPGVLIGIDGDAAWVRWTIAHERQERPLSMLKRV